MTDRRDALKKMGAILAGSVLGEQIIASPSSRMSSTISSDERFSGGKAVMSNNSDAGLKIRFLGTGAADWNTPNTAGELRRFSSILVEDHLLIDFTSKNKEMLPKGIRPDTIFYTHSHYDHYNPEAVLSTGGIRQVYVSHTWYDFAKKDFSAAASRLKVNRPVITPVFIGQTIEIGDLKISPAPANHATEKVFEQCLIYLIEKKDIRLLYATDTGGLTAAAARIAGIDSHQNGKRLTALIMEATMGIRHHIDYRIFTHSSVGDVERTVKVLTSTKRYRPAEGQPVYLTHMAKGLHGTMTELEKELPAPLKAAYDGLEIIFQSPS